MDLTAVDFATMVDSGLILPGMFNSEDSYVSLTTSQQSLEMQGWRVVEE